LRRSLQTLAIAALAALQVACGGGAAQTRGVADDELTAERVASTQRADGFFVFSVHDTQPPVIAETYFAVVALHYLKRPISRAAILKASLDAFSREATVQLTQGSPTLDSRDLYEIAMLYRMLDLPMDVALISAYLPRLEAAAVRTDRAIDDLRNWYFAVMTLVAANRVTPREAGAVNSSLAGLLTRAQSMPVTESALASALLVDAAVATGSHITSVERNMALRNAGIGQISGSFKPDYASDVLSTFYTVLMAADLDASRNLDAAAIAQWIDSRRNHDLYSIANGQPASPLGTAYAVELRSLLKDQALSEVLR
jgi:hypothetical protein